MSGRGSSSRLGPGPPPGAEGRARVRKAESQVQVGEPSPEQVSKSDPHKTESTQDTTASQDTMPKEGRSSRLGPGPPPGAEGRSRAAEVKSHNLSAEMSLKQDPRKAGSIQKTTPKEELSVPVVDKNKIEKESIPSGTPHPHFPCVAVRESSLDDIMKFVADGIKNTADEVLWQSSAEDKHEVSATVFIGSQRIGVSVCLFATERNVGGGEVASSVLLQAFCPSGYGWDFYTIWDGILTTLRKNDFQIQRYVPALEEEPSKPSQQESLTEQLRASQIPVQYSTASNPPLEELPEIKEEDLALPPQSVSDIGIDTMTNLLGAPYDGERCAGIDLVESSIDNQEIREAVQVPLFECLGADSSYAESRIRALSLVRKMVKDKYISNESLPVSYLRKGLNHLNEESKQNEEQTPAFKHMMREYSELALKVIGDSAAGKELVPSLEEAKQQ